MVSRRPSVKMLPDRDRKIKPKPVESRRVADPEGRSRTERYRTAAFRGTERRPET
jgi:hypothetical protein